MTRCANAMGAGMTALHLLPRSAGFAITSHLPARWLSGLASSFTSNVSEVQS